MSKHTKIPLAAQLCAAWSKAFANGPNPKPLKVGIHLDILSSGRFEAEAVARCWRPIREDPPTSRRSHWEPTA
jgi:hypothetical protein